MSEFNVLLIGTGQLGSRHLQGLAMSDLDLRIILVEPEAENLKTALLRFEEAKPSKSVHILKTASSPDELKEDLFHLVIIATNADIRAEITKRLLNRHQVKNIIFEKVAFQSEHQFEEIILLLKEKKVKSWVNCARRYFPFYIKLKEELKEKGPFELEVEGVDWGLACNSVHHIDLLAYLSGEPTYLPAKQEFVNEIFSSKRAGFMEFYGSFSGQSLSGNRFKLSCRKSKDESEKPRFTIQIKHGTEMIQIDEGAGKAGFFKNGQLSPFRTETVTVLFQSGLSNIQAKQILETSTSLLPSLEESYESHKPLFRVLRAHLKELTGEYTENLQIT